VSLLDKAILGRQAVSLSLGGSVDIWWHQHPYQHYRVGVGFLYSPCHLCPIELTLVDWWQRLADVSWPRHFIYLTVLSTSASWGWMLSEGDHHGTRKSSLYSLRSATCFYQWPLTLIFLSFPFFIFSFQKKLLLLSINCTKRAKHSGPVIHYWGGRDQVHVHYGWHACPFTIWEQSGQKSEWDSISTKKLGKMSCVCNSRDTGGSGRKIPI
jgi:hypothetical protein